MTTEQLSEAERAARVPGIEFVDGTDGTRRAKPIGTGLEVWELMRIWWACEENMEEVTVGWTLERSQVEAALSYYGLFTEEIDWHLAECERAYDEAEANGLTWNAPSSSEAHQRR